MKKILAVFFCLTVFVCLTLGGCRSADNGILEENSNVVGNQTENSSTQDVDTDDRENVPVNKALLGVWWWSDSLGEEYLDFAADNGVTEIYFSSSKFNDKTDEFIANAAAKGMEVYWLAGEYQWVEDPSGLHKKVEKYKNYQESHEHKFAGIHFDIEPHQHAEFKDRREELIGKFVELTYDLKEKYSDIWIEYDLPFWLETEITARNVTKPAFQHIMDNASRVTLMSYRDTAEKIYGVSEAEINYAKATGKKLNLGVNTKSNEGDQVSFQEEGKQCMYDEIVRLREMLPENFGVVIHHMKAWYDLKD